MKWRWFWMSSPPPPLPPREPLLDPRVIHEAQKLDAGLAKLEGHVEVLGNGRSMTMLLDETLRALKK